MSASKNVNVLGVEMPEHCLMYSIVAVALIFVFVLYKIFFGGSAVNTYKKTDGDSNTRATAGGAGAAVAAAGIGSARPSEAVRASRHRSAREN